MDKLLQVKNLSVHFDNEVSYVKAVEDVNFDVGSGEIRGIVGESGCGKSVTARAILRILNRRGSIPKGKILYNKDGETTDLTSLNKYGEDIRKIRASEISMVFQEPMSAFSPVYTIGNQIMEVILLHQKVSKKEARGKTAKLLKSVGLQEAIIDEYPHKISGGMCQRAVIAMALSCNPNLLIADEPTTALDVTIQAQILDLLKKLQKDVGMSIIFITHDLAVIADIADTVSVMYLGKIMEEGTVEQIFNNPIHPYTLSLMKSIPSIEKRKGKYLDVIQGSVPDAAYKPNGCYFHPRCYNFKKGLCDTKTSEGIEVEKGHKVYCMVNAPAGDEVKKHE